MIQFIEIEQENGDPMMVGVARIEMVAPGDEGKTTKIWFAGEEQPVTAMCTYAEFRRICWPPVRMEERP